MVIPYVTKLLTSPLWVKIVKIFLVDIIRKKTKTKPKFINVCKA